MPATLRPTETRRLADGRAASPRQPSLEVGPAPRFAGVGPWRRLSHELGTPLHAILGHAELLLEGSFGPLGGEVRACVSEIQGAGRQLAQEFRRLLLIIEACGAAPQEREAIDGEALLKTAFAGRSVAVTWRGGPLIVRGEAFWLRAMAEAIADMVAADGRDRKEPVVVDNTAGDLELSGAGRPLVEGEPDAIAQALVEVVARRHDAEALWASGERLQIRGLGASPDASAAD